MRGSSMPACECPTSTTFHSGGNDLPDEFISDVVDVEAGSIAALLGAATGYIDREAANPAGSGGQNQVADHIPSALPICAAQTSGGPNSTVVKAMKSLRAAIAVVP
ncbi:hypothetical protein [Mycobacterium sp. 23]|uniref:hypothetical protein n=1 Tax=Mycobacterium sp. 23 TaxID=3400424 RepID=UPI003AAB96B8